MTINTTPTPIRSGPSASIEEIIKVFRLLVAANLIPLSPYKRRVFESFLTSKLEEVERQSREKCLTIFNLVLCNKCIHKAKKLLSELTDKKK